MTTTTTTPTPMTPIATTSMATTTRPEAPPRSSIVGLDPRASSPLPTSMPVVAAAVVGPVVLAASSLAWLVDAAELRAILTFWAFPVLALGLAGVVARLERTTPRTRGVLTALVLVGACAGSAFGLEAAVVEHFGVERLIEQDTPSAILTLKLPGPVFPLSLVAIGLLSFRHRTLPRRSAALLAVAGVLFPLSRIPQLPALALVADVALLAAMVPVPLDALRGRWAARR